MSTKIKCWDPECDIASFMREDRTDEYVLPLNDGTIVRLHLPRLLTEDTVEKLKRFLDTALEEQRRRGG